jgi:hypothetical protein
MVFNATFINIKRKRCVMQFSVNYVKYLRYEHGNVHNILQLPKGVQSHHRIMMIVFR